MLSRQDLRQDVVMSYWLLDLLILLELLIISDKLFYKLYACLNFVLAWQNRVKETTDTASSASFLDLYLEFNDSGHLTTKLYDKRDDFNFKIINFPNICSNIPASPGYGVYISQFIRYARTISNYSDFLKHHLYLRNRLLDQGYEQMFHPPHWIWYCFDNYFTYFEFCLSLWKIVRSSVIYYHYSNVTFYCLHVNQRSCFSSTYNRIWPIKTQIIPPSYEHSKSIYLQYMNESANDFKVMLKIYFCTHPTITCKQEFFSTNLSNRLANSFLIHYRIIMYHLQTNLLLNTLSYHYVPPTDKPAS